MLFGEPRVGVDQIKHRPSLNWGKEYNCHCCSYYDTNFLKEVTSSLKSQNILFRSLLLFSELCCSHATLDFVGVYNIACQTLCYFEVCINQTSIRYGSCLLDSYFLDRSFQMYQQTKQMGQKLKRNVQRGDLQ